MESKSTTKTSTTLMRFGNKTDTFCYVFAHCPIVCTETIRNADEKWGPTKWISLKTLRFVGENEDFWKRWRNLRHTTSVPVKIWASANAQPQVPIVFERFTVYRRKQYKNAVVAENISLRVWQDVNESSWKWSFRVEQMADLIPNSKLIFHSKVLV